MCRVDCRFLPHQPSGRQGEALCPRILAKIIPLIVHGLHNICLQAIYLTLLDDFGMDPLEHIFKAYNTIRKPQLDWRYNLLVCTSFVFMDACIKIDTISNLWACLFGQQLTKYPL
jgi:hypothetical protein